jgi:hypothetical protein
MKMNLRRDSPSRDEFEFLLIMAAIMLDVWFSRNLFLETISFVAHLDTGHHRQDFWGVPNPRPSNFLNREILGAASRNQRI